MAFSKLLDLLAPGSSWERRVKEGAYKSPLGVRVPFLFEQLSRETNKRTAKFEFNGLDGWYVQQNGYSGRDYPLRCLFTGKDHDLLASSFEEGLLERGVGKLEHPLYGTFDVVPTGTISRRNDLVEAANESVVEVTFSTTLAQIYPAGFGFPVSEILASIDGFNLAAALQLQNATSLASKVSQATGKATIKKVLGAVRSSLEEVSYYTAESRRAFDSQVRLINEGMDVLIGQPLLLAEQMLNLIQAPARALAGIADRLAGYAAFAESLLTRARRDGASTVGSDVQTQRNEFHLTDLAAMGAVSGAIISTTSRAGLRSRPAALQVAENVKARFDEVIEWREQRLAELGEFDEGASYQALQEASARASGYLVDLSFNLLPERRLVTDQATTPVNLCAQLYRSLSDERLQFLIDTNRLTGSEILEIPKGRTIVWYA